MRHSHLSYAFLLSFVVCIFALHWWQQPSYPTLLWIGLGAAASLSAYALLYARIRRWAALSLAILLGITLAVAAVARHTHVATPADVDFHAEGRKAEIAGIIVDEPDIRPTLARYTIETETVRFGTGAPIHVRGLTLITDAARWPRHAYGDRVIARGTLGHADDPTYAQYLARFGIYTMLDRAAVTSTGSNVGNPVLATLYNWKEAIESRIEALYPEPHSSLLQGLLTGSRRGMPPHLQDDFRRTGLTHLVAISGYNITILLAALSALLFWLPLRWRFVPCLLVLAGFTLLVGASASVVRASVMGGLGLLALQLGRAQTMRLTVLWTLFLMLSWNPLQLWYDAGFQLSFLALLGILEVAPLLEPHFAPLPDRFGIRDALRLTVAAQIATVPWMLYLFGKLSVIAPVSNLLAPPVVPYAMLAGTTSLLLSLLWFPLGQAAASIAWVFLEWIIRVASFLGRIPFGSLQTEGTSVWFVTLCYALLVSWIGWKQHGKGKVTEETYGEMELPPPSPSSRRGRGRGEGAPTSPSSTHA